MVKNNLLQVYQTVYLSGKDIPPPEWITEACAAVALVKKGISIADKSADAQLKAMVKALKSCAAKFKLTNALPFYHDFLEYMSGGKG